MAPRQANPRQRDALTSARLSLAKVTRFSPSATARALERQASWGKRSRESP